jgi:hypothetical protein
MNNHQPEFFLSAVSSSQVQPSQVIVQRKVYVPPKLTPQGPTPTPLPVRVSPVTEKIQYQYQLAVPILQAIPRTPPCSIPGYYTSKPSHEGPGVGEMLLGCGILLALGVAVFTLLFFLAT